MLKLYLHLQLGAAARRHQSNYAASCYCPAGGSRHTPSEDLFLNPVLNFMGKVVFYFKKRGVVWISRGHPLNIKLLS